MESSNASRTDPAARARINAGTIEYTDLHLSHVAQQARAGFFGAIDVAVIEVAGILADGRLLPSTSLGSNKAWLELAGKVILEVNRAQPAELEGMHDIYYGMALPPHRVPIPLVKPDDRIGEAYLRVDPARVVAVVATDAPDRHLAFTADATSSRIAAHLLDFLSDEIKRGRLPPQLLPLQSGVGNIANAVLAGLSGGGYRAALFHLGALRRLNELGGSLHLLISIPGLGGH